MSRKLGWAGGRQGWDDDGWEMRLARPTCWHKAGHHDLGLGEKPWSRALARMNGHLKLAFSSGTLPMGSTPSAIIIMPCIYPRTGAAVAGWYRLRKPIISSCTATTCCDHGDRSPVIYFKFSENKREQFQDKRCVIYRPVEMMDEEDNLQTNGNYWQRRWIWIRDKIYIFF